MTQSLIQIADRSGKVIGSAGMLDAFARQLIRNTVYVILVDAYGKYLLQRRSLSVPNYPGYWDASAGGHIDALETPRVAAYRELAEELGIHSVPLEHRSSFYFEAEGDDRLYRYFAHVYMDEYVGDEEIVLSSAEVSESGFYSRQEMEHLDKLTPITRRIVGMT